MKLIDGEPQVSRRDVIKGIGAWAATIVFGRPKEMKNPDNRLPPETFFEQEQLREYCEAYTASARKNIIIYPSGEKVIIPSPAYTSGIYGRDSFFSVMGLSDIQMGSFSYRQFEEGQHPETGQIPTQILFNHEDKTERWHDDETTMLFLIWSSVVKGMGEKVDPEKINKALGFIQKHVRDSQYYSEAGDFKYWADTLINPQRQVITYDQGLYACALQSCFENNWGSVTFDEVEKAKEGYREIWRQNCQKGYLPQAQGQEIIDLSALFPEVLSRFLFNEPILPDQTVLTTIDNFLAKASVVNKETGELHGIKIICNGDGSFLLPKAISVPAFNEPGDYQNGGYWPMWTLVDLALAFKIAPKSQKEEYRQIILKLLNKELAKDGKAKEYIRLCPDPVVLGSTEEIRHQYSWNVLFNPMARWAGLDRVY